MLVKVKCELKLFSGGKGEAPPQDANQPPPTDTVEEAEYTVVEEDEKK